MDAIMIPIADAVGSEPVEIEPSVANLAFIVRPTVAIRLRYPFIWEGGLVETIDIRRLTTADLIYLAAMNGDLFDAYGLMTGLDPAVLRGLDAEDGDKVTTAAHALLPAVLLG